VNAVVFGMMKDAADLEGECGLPFVPRRIVYRIRDPVLKLTGKELTQTYFNGLLTEYEAEHGELHPRMVRSPRGFFYVPHVGLEIPLGTQSVAEFRRQAWTFNKILAIEKDDLRKALQVSGWPNGTIVCSCPRSVSTHAPVAI
jgi:hypothetical protein